MDYFTKERLRRVLPYVITLGIILFVGILNLSIQDATKPL